jgi:S1-C subfamily serine protease
MPSSFRSLAVSAVMGIVAGGVVTVAGAEILGHGGGNRTIFQSTPSGTAGTQAIAAKASTAQEIYRTAAPSVVAVQATGGGGFGGGGQTDTGTGFVVSSDGLIITNEHVIDGAQTISVSFNGSGGASRTATLVGADPSKDLALLRVSTTGLNLHPLQLADSSAVQVGDPVYAIGDPYGLDQTLTTGIISASDRTIQAPNGGSIGGALQTDAALNPGNSGGPLLDASGRVIGVNSQIATANSGNFGGSQSGNTGVGFAIASNTVQAALPGLKRGGATSSTQQQPQVQVVVPQGGGYGAGGYGYGYGP